MRALQLALASALLGIGLMNNTSAADKLTVGVALPRAQLGQPNGTSADVADPVRQALMSYLKGPVIEVIALEARIPVQIAAEAKEKGCAFVLYTDVAQTAKGRRPQDAQEAGADGRHAADARRRRRHG